MGTVGSGIGAGKGVLRVLCVDDNRDVVDSEVLLLEVAGFEARACYDGASALREAAGFRPDVCLVDLNMPGMGGDVLAARLRERAAGTPLVLVAVTAMSDAESGDRIRRAGFDLHLVKPVDPLRLVSNLKSVWAARAPGE